MDKIRNYKLKLADKNFGGKQLDNKFKRSTLKCILGDDSSLMRRIKDGVSRLDYSQMKIDLERKMKESAASRGQLTSVQPTSEPSYSAQINSR
jgi:hypothetical protein